MIVNKYYAREYVVWYNMVSIAVIIIGLYWLFIDPLPLLALLYSVSKDDSYFLLAGNRQSIDGDWGY